MFAPHYYNWLTGKMPFSWYFFAVLFAYLREQAKAAFVAISRHCNAYRHSAQRLFSTSGGGVGLVC